MKFASILLGCCLCCSQHNQAQVHITGKWTEYQAQIERTFQTTRENWEKESVNDNPVQRRWEESNMNEWDRRAMLITKDTTLSDSAKVASGFEAYWDLFSLCRDKWAY